jgi:hypothetical protein
MDDRYQTIADVEVTEQDAPRLAEEVVAWLVETGVVVAERTNCACGVGHAPGPEFGSAVVAPDETLHTVAWNGLRVEIGRTVFYAKAADQLVYCPHCDAEVDLERIADAFEEWQVGAAGTRECPICTRELDPNGWRWEPPWGFGALGLTFWNWPPLRPEFVAELTARLGHRTVLVADKL